MTKNVIINCHNVTKHYFWFRNNLERFLYAMKLTKGQPSLAASLGPINLQVTQGESIGIIGNNGAGKSTLLKILAGVIKPTSGKLEVKGKVGAILELGVGFHPEWTGRENVMFNAFLNGLDETKARERIEEIEAFADIGAYFDVPIKYYSSGMLMRVAFAVMTHLDADILIIDEALAVGDGRFVVKCLEKMNEKKASGTTIFFCSHALYQVSSFCDRCLWLHQGKIVMDGKSSEVVTAYEEFLANEKRKKFILDNNNNNELQPSNISQIAQIRNLSIEPQATLETGSKLSLFAEIQIYESLEVSLGFALDRNDGICVFADGTHTKTFSPLWGPGTFKVEVLFPKLPLLDGRYKFVFFVLTPDGLVVLDQRETSLFSVENKDKLWGICKIPCEWHLEKTNTG